MQDTLRDRLLTFIAKWSPEALAFEAGHSGKQPPPTQLVDNCSLVTWETVDPANPQGRVVLRVARGAHDGRVPCILDSLLRRCAIPVEVGRLRSEPVANDYNPVVYLILRSTCELPQRFRRPDDAG